MSWLVGDNDEYEVTPDFVASVMEHALSRADEMATDPPEQRDAFGAARTLLTAVAIEAVHQMAQDGLLRDETEQRNKDLYYRLQDILSEHAPHVDASDDEEATCNLKAIAAIERLVAEETPKDDHE